MMSQHVAIEMIDCRWQHGLFKRKDMERQHKVRQQSNCTYYNTQLFVEDDIHKCI